MKVIVVSDLHSILYDCECDVACAEKRINCSITESIHDKNINVFNGIDDIVSFMIGNNL